MNLSIVVPAYNESGNLPNLLDDFERFVAMAACQVEVIAVDDGSRDNTRDLLHDAARARPWLTVIALPQNRGMGAALKVGTRAAAHELVAWVMADRSDRFSDLLEMRALLIDGAELVVASRAVNGGSYGELGGLKALGSRFFSMFARLALRLPIDDTTNAFRAFRKTLFDQLDLRRDDFAISPEMVIAAHARGARIEQVATVYSFRQRGMSNFAMMHMGLAYLRLTLRAFMARLGGGR